jgi:hypothetical protein
MRNSDLAWVALAGGVAAYDLIATDDEQLTTRPAGTSSLSRLPPLR